jgi:hypothetical protein
LKGGDNVTYEKPAVESKIDVKGIMGLKSGPGAKNGQGGGGGGYH